MNSVLKEVKYSFLLLLGTIACLLFTLFIPLLVIKYLDFKIIVYVLIYIIISFGLWKIFKKKHLEFMYRLPLVPFYILFKILTYTIPFNLIIMNVILYLTFPIILVTYSSFALTYFDLQIKFELKLYLSFLFVYLFYVTFNKSMLFYVAKLSPARYKDSKKLKPYNIKEISEYLLSQDNLKILIYSFNFLVIIFINIYKLQNLNFNNNVLLYENPILQSLVTFIAFDRAITLFKGLKFKPSELYEKILTGIKNKKETLK